MNRGRIVHSGFLSLWLFAAGCTGTQPNVKAPGDEPIAKPETMKEAESALGSVVGAVSGQEISSKDLQNLSKQLRKDAETQSVVESITESMTGQETIKYCPVKGERYSAKFKTCPIHGVPLKEVE